MKWVALVIALLNAAGAAIQYLRERRLLKEADEKAVATLLKRQAKALEDAEKIRAAALSELTDDDRLRENDGFRRD